MYRANRAKRSINWKYSISWLPVYTPISVNRQNIILIEDNIWIKANFWYWLKLSTVLWKYVIYSGL